MFARTKARIRAPSPRSLSAGLWASLRFHGFGSDSGMKPLTASAACVAPRERIWPLLTETRYWPVWGPSVRAVDPADATITAGSSGRVLTTGGLWLDFEISGYEAGRFWTWRVAGVEATGHRLIECAGGTRIVFELPFWAVAYWPVCRIAAVRIARLAEGSGQPWFPGSSP